jgi:hypothetical protein
MSFFLDNFPNNLVPNIHLFLKIRKKEQNLMRSTSLNIMIVHSKKARFTWYNEGFIQVDFYNPSRYDVKDIEHLIKDILKVDTASFSGESIGSETVRNYNEEV